MKEHLQLLQRYKKVLGLSLNAKEDLLINGAAQPSHRGVCLHLLGKVERPNVTRALERIPDAAARSRLLAGVVRFSDDQGVLLQWLESLSDSASRTAAAGALSTAVDRLDWASMSPARMERLLDVMATVFTEPHERADVVFGLLHSPSFRSTFEAAADRLPKPLAEVFSPLHAAFDAVVGGDGSNHPPAMIRKGVSILLSAPDSALQARPPAIRERLLRAALAAPPSDADADRAAGALLESLSDDPDTYRRMTLERVGELLRRHSDQRAEWHLKRLRGAQPNCAEAKELSLALGAPRLGRIVLGRPDDWRPKPPGHRGPDRTNRKQRGLQPGFWLDRLRPVWLRAGGDKAKVAAEAARHRALSMAGLAPLLASGSDKRPWLAFAQLGEPADEVLSGGPPPLGPALILAAAGVRILGSLAVAGLRLPDARPHRFLIVRGDVPVLLLHDLSGAVELEEGPSEAPPGQAAGWARDVLHGLDLPPGVQRLLGRRKGGAKALLAEIEASL
jgi:hypothetical protein